MSDIQAGDLEFEILDEVMKIPSPSARIPEPDFEAVTDLEPDPAGSAGPAGEPIYILSCNRSGSTLLRFILDTHPDIYCPPELYLGQAAHSLAIFLCGLEGRTAYYEGHGKFYLSQSIAETLRTVIRDRMAAHTAQRGKRFWCEKTPQNLFHVRLIDHLFPHAKYICLHRHCLDVTASAMEMAGRISSLQKSIYKASGDVLAGTIRWWCEMSRASLRFERRHPGRCIRIRYEDLVTQPGATLEPLFGFLGVPWEESLLDAVFSAQHDRGYEDPNIRFTASIRADTIGSGSALSLETVPDDILATMRGLLAELGYPEASSRPADAAAPGPWADKRISARWFFETYLRGQIEAMPEVAASIHRCFRFALDGPGGGAWDIDFRREDLQIVNERESVTMMMSTADLAPIFQGSLNLRKALLEGRIRLAGHVELGTLEKLSLLMLQPSPRAEEGDLRDLAITRSGEP